MLQVDYDMKYETDQQVTTSLTHVSILSTFREISLDGVTKKEKNLSISARYALNLTPV